MQFSESESIYIIYRFGYPRVFTKLLKLQVIIVNSWLLNSSSTSPGNEFLELVPAIDLLQLANNVRQAVVLSLLEVDTAVTASDTVVKG